MEWKFRAFDKEKRIMSDPFTLEDLNQARINGFEPDGGEDNYIKMASTGLSDKNGQEIFEGDIDQDGGVVEWAEDEAGFIYNHPSEAMSLQGSLEWFEIAGNRWANPELLDAQA